MTERIQINNLDDLKSYSFKNGKELICFLIDEADSFPCPLYVLDLIRLTKNKRQLVYFDLNDFPKSSEYQLYSFDKQDIKENIKKRILDSYPELKYYL